MMKCILALGLLAAAGCASAPRTDCAQLNEQMRRREPLTRPDGGALAARNPRVRDKGRIERLAEDSVAALGLDTLSHTAMLRLRVTAEGAPDNVRVTEPSGSVEFDSIAAWAMRQAQFVPASLDRCPVAVWIEVPLSVTPRS